MFHMFLHSPCAAQDLQRLPPIFVQNTTCSAEVFSLGPGQRVVSFTYYEGLTYDTVYKRDYFAGVAVNAEAIARQLPRDFRMRRVLLCVCVRKAMKMKPRVHKLCFQSSLFLHLCRLYYQISKNSSTLARLCKLACDIPNLDLCDVERNPKYKNARYSCWNRKKSWIVGSM